MPKEVQKSQLCALRSRGAGLAGAGVGSPGPVGAGRRSRLRQAPGAGRGGHGGPDRVTRGLTWSCWLRAAAATASRAATSTFPQRLRAPPRPRSPLLPKPPPLGGQFNPAELRPPPRESPRSLPPPGPRTASPVRSEEVEESQRRILWPQIATRLPPSAPPSPSSLLPPKSEAHARGNQKLRPAGKEGRQGRGGEAKPRDRPERSQEPGGGMASPAQSLDLA
ncbi:hypothetical protein GH733_018365 [Mirounga leonina]|nr:hypothetical protein GH733_018365 [Mirounga leonina]